MRCYFLFPDKLYLKIVYRLKMGRKLNLDHPLTFSEKIQWLKLYNRNPLYTSLVDKREVKHFVAECIGEEFVIPTLGVWDIPEDIEWDLLPRTFVLKTTHVGGNSCVLICRDSNSFNRKSAINKLKKGMHQNIFGVLREWPYKNVHRCIIAEQLLESSHIGNNLYDYKFFCFGGKCKFFKIDFDRFVDHHANYYDLNGCLLPFGEIDYPPILDKRIVLPNNIQEMVKIAEKLTASINAPFVRIDLYNVDGRVYFGEITLYPASGLGKFSPEEWDLTLGDWVSLPQKTGNDSIRF